MSTRMSLGGFGPPRPERPAAVVPRRCDDLRRRKSAGVALVLSFLIPGLGHFYVDRVGIGVVVMGFWAIGALLTLTIIGAVLGIPLMFAMWLFGLIHSAVVAERA